MIVAETFWWLLTMAALAWYMTVTLYVAVRGALDIRRMLRALAAQGADAASERHNDDRSGERSPPVGYGP
jgi:hypothetical protein